MTWLRLSVRYLRRNAAAYGTPLESLLLTLAMGVPLAGAFLAGSGSLSLVYGYVFLFDYLRCMGYSNVEVISHRAFQAFPPLRYLIYTPTCVSPSFFIHGPNKCSVFFHHSDPKFLSLF